MSVLKIKGLCVRHGSDILVDNLNFCLQTGKITALVGKSGSGKTLSAATLQGFTPSNLRSNVEIYLDEKLQDKNIGKSKIFASVMQNPRTAFNPLMSMQAHAIETLKASGNFNTNFKRDIMNAFSDVGLESSVLKLYSFQMSGGMLQRAMIALALLSRAKFIIADEPTTDLDLIVQVKILELLKQIVLKNDLGMLLITHDFGVVAKIADEVIVMNEGKIIEVASVDEIFLDAKSSAAKKLLGAHLSLYRGL